MYACRAWLTGSTAGLGKLVTCADPGLGWLVQHIAGCIGHLPWFAPAFWQCHCLLQLPQTSRKDLHKYRAELKQALDAYKSKPMEATDSWHEEVCEIVSGRKKTDPWAAGITELHMPRSAASTIWAAAAAHTSPHS